jgi:hypothetical protein
MPGRRRTALILFGFPLLQKVATRDALRMELERALTRSSAYGEG